MSGEEETPYTGRPKARKDGTHVYLDMPTHCCGEDLTPDEALALAAELAEAASTPSPVTLADLAAYERVRRHKAVMAAVEAPFVEPAAEVRRRKALVTSAGIVYLLDAEQPVATLLGETPAPSPKGEKTRTNEVTMDQEPILQFFEYSHLPEGLQAISKPFCDVAHWIVETLPRNAERTVSLRKVLEAKDAAVRAALAK